MIITGMGTMSSNNKLTFTSSVEAEQRPEASHLRWQKPRLTRWKASLPFVVIQPQHVSQQPRHIFGEPGLSPGGRSDAGTHCFPTLVAKAVPSARGGHKSNSNWPVLPQG